MADPPLSQVALRVFVRALVIDAEIGLYRHERGRRQPLLVEIDLDLAPAVVGGLSDTVNYETLAASAQAIADAGHIDLVETYAQRLAAACLADPRGVRVRVRVEKPEALGGSAIAGVEITAAR